MTPPDVPPRLRRRKVRKLDAKKVEALHAQGVATIDIAKHQGVAVSTVWRYLKDVEASKGLLATFKQNRADCLSHLQSRTLSVQHQALDGLEADLARDRLNPTLSPDVKTKILQTCAIAGAIAYDKYRLESGLMTAQVGVLTAILTEAHSDLPRRLRALATLPPVERGEFT